MLSLSMLFSFLGCPGARSSCLPPQDDVVPVAAGTAPVAAAPRRLHRSHDDSRSLAAIQRDAYRLSVRHGRNQLVCGDIAFPFGRARCWTRDELVLTHHAAPPRSATRGDWGAPAAPRPPRNCGEVMT